MAPMLIPGTDWAHWQGSIDFHKMASQGVRVGFGKVSQGRTPDPKWTTYARAAKAAGLFVGGYLFLDATSTASAAEQASLFLSQLAKGAPNMIHMYDAEWDGGWSDGDAARIAYYRDVMNRVDGALGRKGPIYTIKSFWRDYCANTTAFLDHEMIVAAPLNGMPPVNAGDWDTWAEGRGPEEPKYWAVGSWAKWGGWQFAVPAGSGPTYGVQSSAIDMDLYDPATIARWTNQPIPPDPPEPQGFDMPFPFKIADDPASASYVWLTDGLRYHQMRGQNPVANTAVGVNANGGRFTVVNYTKAQAREVAGRFEKVYPDDVPFPGYGPDANDEATDSIVTAQKAILDAIHAIPAVAEGVISPQDIINGVAGLLNGMTSSATFEVPGA